MRIVQLQGPHGGRAAIVEGESLRLLRGCDSVYTLAMSAIDEGRGLAAAAEERATSELLEYDPIYRGESEWRLLPPLTHPEPARCLVSGTGLTHKASADNRNAMHRRPEDLTDSMRMYLSGVEGGRPAPGAIGVAPEWFYKGCGSILRGHGDPLEAPPYACDGGEEPEVAGLYVIDGQGRPRRVGFAMGNEFSDHVLEKKNYLYLAHSKLRTCAVGPELVVGAAFDSVGGTVLIERGGQILWQKAIGTGEAKMSHTVANLEHHHFKYPAHRRPGDAHVHFFGADGFSFGAGVALADGDVMVVAFEGFGRPLRNPLRLDRNAEERVEVAAV